MFYKLLKTTLFQMSGLRKNFPQIFYPFISIIGLLHQRSHLYNNLITLKTYLFIKILIFNTGRQLSTLLSVLKTKHSIRGMFMSCFIDIWIFGKKGKEIPRKNLLLFLYFPITDPPMTQIKPLLYKTNLSTQE